MLVTLAIHCLVIGNMWDELTKYIFSALKTQILFHSQVHLFIFDPKISTDVFVIFENVGIFPLWIQARLKTWRPWSTFCLRVVSYTFVIVKSVIFLLYVQIRWELSAGSCFVFMSEVHVTSVLVLHVSWLTPNNLKTTTFPFCLGIVLYLFIVVLSKNEMEAADNSPELSFSISSLSYWEKCTHPPKNSLKLSSCRKQRASAAF